MLSGMVAPQNDIIVIGASAGGLNALEYIARTLPRDLPACVLVVLHISPESEGSLAQILGRRAALAVKRAQTGDPIDHGRMYVAPPDHHLLVRGGSIELSRGPRENRSRPALDPLFRSAALNYGSRVTGVVLTGLLDDGTAGLMAVKRAGGVAIVQDPSDADFSGMPLSALARVSVDHCVPLHAIPLLLDALARGRPVPSNPPNPAILPGGKVAENPSRRMDPKLELELLTRGLSPQKMTEELGPPLPVTCPECGGPLWELRDGSLRRFRCHLGHGLTASASLAANSELIEQSLWLAARLLEEQAVLLASIAEDESAAQSFDQAHAYEARAQRVRQESERLREFLTRL